MNLAAIADLARTNPTKALAVVRAAKAVESAERIQAYAKPEQQAQFAAYLEVAQDNLKATLDS